MRTIVFLSAPTHDSVSILATPSPLRAPNKAQASALCWEVGEGFAALWFTMLQCLPWKFLDGFGFYRKAREATRAYTGIIIHSKRKTAKQVIPSSAQSSILEISISRPRAVAATLAVVSNVQINPDRMEEDQE
jgi:hypothetical protein